MNREKLEELRRGFQQDESEPGSKADAQLLVADMLELLDALLEDDDAGCPPVPNQRVDRLFRDVTELNWWCEREVEKRKESEK